MAAYKFHRQLDFMDCGPTCLKMVASYYGRDFSLDYLRANAYITRNGVSLMGISEAAEKIHLKSLAVKLSLPQLAEEVPFPCILHWNQEHFVVLYDVKPATWYRKQAQFIVADPGHSLITLDEATFSRCWVSTGDQQGVALLLEPTPEFYEHKEPTAENLQVGFGFLLNYLRPYRRYIYQIVLGMLFGSLISLVFPFLTQSLVDYGIARRNLNFVYLILASQLLLFVGNIAVDMIRNWVLLHINTRISITIISNFLIKLMKLPITFFESKNIGDISQRINDHHRIETFLTGSTLSTLFSFINLVIFSFVLSTYSIYLFGFFLIGSAISVGWVLLFFRRRRELDYKRFQRLRDNQNSLYELITGMQEIKLYNCEKARRWNWERIQAKLFKISVRSLALEQYQEIGSAFFTQLKNILISFFAAKLVIEQQITLGAMLSISYIIGQMNGPLSQIIAFVRSVQDAKISLDRLSEIHNKPDEEVNEEQNVGKMTHLFDDKPGGKVAWYSPENLLGEAGLVLQNVSFRYGGGQSGWVLKNVSLNIPKGKVTAIVGASGSGKTTLMKLLLKFYPPIDGDIYLDGINLRDISARQWRNNCGTVMQDSYIFSDTIARNIAVDGQRIDEDRLLNAVHVANIHQFVHDLPLGFTTRIGNTGTGLSGGQRQRVVLARAVYKSPQYLFFDEATSALDANNERIIMDNLGRFFEGRTVVVIAHRLSTVRHADQIIVLNKGEVQECGTHRELADRRGLYYELVRNQLELGAA